MSEAVDQSSPAARVATGRDWKRSVSFFLVLAVLTVPFLLLLLLVTSLGRMLEQGRDAVTHSADTLAAVRCAVGERRTVVLLDSLGVLKFRVIAE